VTSDYRPRVERAISFIATNIERPLTLAEVAKVAHTSEFHFHRIFSAVVGEPVGRFITRKRLELAAMRLAYEPERSVTDIALSVGYSSPSNFTKAFTAYFGRAPSAVRRPGDSRGERPDPAALYALPPSAEESERRAIYERLASRVRFVVSEGLDLACLASPQGYDLGVLESLWRELAERAIQLGITSGEIDAYGLAFDSPQLTRPELCRYHACVPCEASRPLPAPLFRGHIPAGRYAVFPYSGAVSEVERHYREIYSVWLPQSSVSPDDFVAVDHYVNDGPVGGAIDFEVWIKVKAKEG
jgi:AraC family transcriptional regulator